MGSARLECIAAHPIDGNTAALGVSDASAGEPMSLRGASMSSRREASSLFPRAADQRESRRSQEFAYSPEMRDHRPPRASPAALAKSFGGVPGGTKYAIQRPWLRTQAFFARSTPAA